MSQESQLNGAVGARGGHRMSSERLSQMLSNYLWLFAGVVVPG